MARANRRVVAPGWNFPREWLPAENNKTYNVKPIWAGVSLRRRSLRVDKLCCRNTRVYNMCNIDVTVPHYNPYIHIIYSRNIFILYTCILYIHGPKKRKFRLYGHIISYTFLTLRAIPTGYSQVSFSFLVHVVTAGVCITTVVTIKQYINNNGIWKIKNKRTKRIKLVHVRTRPTATARRLFTEY